MEVHNALDLLETLETEVGSLYIWLSGVFASDGPAASLFYRMHLEENNHASLVRYVQRLADNNPEIFEDVDLDVEVYQNARAAIRALREAPQPLELSVAVRRAAEIECGAAETHFQTALHESCEELANLLAGLGVGDQAHAKALHELGVERGFLSPDFLPSLKPVVASEAQRLEAEGQGPAEFGEDFWTVPL